MASWTPLGSAIRYTRGKLALREDTWRILHRRGRDVSMAEIFSGHRRVQLELRGLPFGVAA